MRCVLLALVLALRFSEADACSMARTYEPPTNFEHVANAQLIALARVDRFEKEVAHFTILEVLVGRKLKTLSFTANETETRTVPEFSIPPHPPVCVSADFEVGSTYLLILSPWPEGEHPLGSQWAFTRTGDEVREGSLWLETVRHYVRIARNTDHRKRRAELLAVRASATVDPAKEELVRDIDRHLTRPTRWKSVEELREMFESSTDPVLRERVLSAFLMAEQALAARDLAASVLVEGTPEELLGPAMSIAVEAKDRRAFEFAKRRLHMAPVVPSDAYWWRQTMLIGVVGLAQETPEDRAVVLEAWKSSKANETGWIASWIGEHPWPEGMRALNEFIGGAYAGWPDISRALAQGGDVAIVKWAIAERAKKRRDESSIAEDVVANSPLAEADAEARRIIERGGEPLESLVQGYDQATHSNVVPRLADVMKRRTKASDLDFWLHRTLSTHAERGSRDAAELLKQLPKNPPAPVHH